MNRIFVISDTHFGHKKIIDFEAKARPFPTVEDHDAELVRRWNETVKPNDTVWHLGDVLFGREAFATLGLLNGVKKLVMGNHDRYPIDLYREHFSQIVGAAELRGCILTHIPIHPDQFRRYKLNIHGHLHSRKMEDERYINVSAEHTGLAPILLDTVLHNPPNAALRGDDFAMFARLVAEREACAALCRKAGDAFLAQERFMSGEQKADAGQVAAACAFAIMARSNVFSGADLFPNLAGNQGKSPRDAGQIKPVDE